MRTAVDTGRARGNWQMDVSKRTNELDVEEKKVDPVLGREIDNIGNLAPFSTVHITNNLEYVYYLEYVRTSKQHPEGMVEITLVELKTWVSKL